jgi:hypothetical protein
MWCRQIVSKGLLHFTSSAQTPPYKSCWLLVIPKKKQITRPSDNKNHDYVTPPTLAVDVPVINKSALSYVAVSISDIIVPG